MFFVSFVIMYLDDRPCFQNIALLVFTIVGLVAVISTFFWSETLVIVYAEYGDMVRITLHSDYNYVTLYLSNCRDTTPSSLKTTTSYICVSYGVSKCETQTSSDIQVRAQLILCLGKHSV